MCYVTLERNIVCLHGLSAESLAKNSEAANI